MKQIIFVLFFLVSFCSKAQTGTITGTVTYYFSDFRSNEPDVKAKIYVCSPSNDVMTIDSFQTAGLLMKKVDICRQMIALSDTLIHHFGKEQQKRRHSGNYVAERDKAGDDLKNAEMKLQQMGIDAEEKFMALNVRAAAALKNIFKTETNVEKVNKAGKFSLASATGKHYVLIVSGALKGPSITEREGMIDVSCVEVSAEKPVDVSVNFER